MLMAFVGTLSLTRSDVVDFCPVVEALAGSVVCIGLSDLSTLWVPVRSVGWKVSSFSVRELSSNMYVGDSALS